MGSELIASLIRTIKYVKNRNLNVLDALRIEANSGRNRTIAVRPKTIGHEFHLRCKGSDREVFEQVFVQRCYDFKSQMTPKYIVDAGANIGASTLFFADRFPSARIAAIEPSKSNVELLRRNCGALENVTIFERGLYHEPAFLRIKNVGCGRDWAFQTEPCDEAESDVEAISVDAVMKVAGFPYIDLLKIDIEGAELEVFSSGFETWINHVNMLVIELHDFARPVAAKHSSERFLRWMSSKCRSMARISFFVAPLQ